MKFELVVEQGVYRGKKLSIDQPGIYHIGRSVDVHLSLRKDRYVSRHHCHLDVSSEGECVLVDEGSTGGTFVNGKRVVLKTRLEPGDQIKVGRTFLRFSPVPEGLNVKTERARTPSHEKLVSGAVINHYEILGELGRGSMSVVYQARDRRLGREVSLKFLSSPEDRVDTAEIQLSQAPPAQWRQRFEREVRLASQLNHPHIVTVYDVDLTHEPPYLVMELLAKGSLAERLQTPIPWQEALLLIRPLVQALAYAHQAGIVHRDIKPANVMFTAANLYDTPTTPLEKITKQGHLKLVDFGLAHWKAGERLTDAGMILGTPIYMAPEQIKEASVDGRTDIFSLGLILLEAITQQNPLKKRTWVEISNELISDQPFDVTYLDQFKVPPSVKNLIEGAIAKSPEQRYLTCEAFLADLNDCLVTPHRSAPSLAQMRRQRSSSAERPLIQTKHFLELESDEKELLQVLFVAFDRLIVEAEFGRGLSPSRVLRVRPVSDVQAKRYLPAVVKIGPRGLIEQEWQAYQRWVEQVLPQIARIEGEPILGERQGIIRYSLVGSGIFAIQSLTDYYQKTEVTSLCRLLKEQLFKTMDLQWWRMHQTFPGSQWRAEYERFLPANLRLSYLASPSSESFHTLEEDDVSLSRLLSLKEEDHVQLKGGLVTEVNRDRQRLVIESPSTESSTSSGYRLYLENIPNIDQYEEGQSLDTIWGKIEATRHTLLIDLATQALGHSLDFSAMRLPVSMANHSTSHPANYPATLPNPLLSYQTILADSRIVYRSPIHGDLNFENILVNEETGRLSLIDFATVRQGHTLHDLLRLETEVVTKMLPVTLAQVGLPSAAIYFLYRRLHQIIVFTEPVTTVGLPHADLSKALAVLSTIRHAAKNHLFDPADWIEYYQGLIIYLLGSLKFANLDALPQAPLPKQTAFWGAATVVELLQAS